MRQGRREKGAIGRTLHRVHSFLFEEGIAEQEQYRRNMTRQEIIAEQDRRLEEQLNAPVVKIQPEEGVEEVRTFALKISNC